MTCGPVVCNMWYTDWNMVRLCALYKPHCRNLIVSSDHCMKSGAVHCSDKDHLCSYLCSQQVRGYGNPLVVEKKVIALMWKERRKVRRGGKEGEGRGRQRGKGGRGRQGGKWESMNIMCN